MFSGQKLTFAAKTFLRSYFYMHFDDNSPEDFLSLCKNGMTVVKFWLPRKYQKVMFFHKISRLRIFLVVRLRFGAYIEQTQPL